MTIRPHGIAECLSPMGGCRRCRPGEMTCPTHRIPRCESCTACPTCAAEPGTVDHLVYLDDECPQCGKPAPAIPRYR